MIGQSIYSVLRQDSLPAPAQGLSQRISSMECTILNRYQTPLDVSLTVLPTSDQTGLHTTLIKLEDQSALTRLVYRSNEFSAHYTFDSIIGTSPSIQSVQTMGRIAATTAITHTDLWRARHGKGDSGPGHPQRKPLGKGPLRRLNCGKIPRGLLESELFGYEGGVFCGGKENGYTGKFEQANGGTLFLDEIDCLSLEAQASLLQVLQTGQVTRLGGKYPKSVSFKLIVATTVNLLSADAEKELSCRPVLPSQRTCHYKFLPSGSGKRISSPSSTISSRKSPLPLVLPQFPWTRRPPPHSSNTTGLAIPGRWSRSSKSSSTRRRVLCFISVICPPIC